ncbi:glycosyltransferase [Paenibacillus alkaliterrae]|uniref:glycosyltransferase n=1 Tax=Paenibacillus alkaliterrae TaxID=320909 RepID=UPI001F29E9DF|nr:glycosyltransferase [Paenibacillus alkaliterrae]MCF2940392.1 glycosyltransferase [Paenibacillus alkaliterrae]
MTSIILVAFNKLAFTQECIESIRAYTEPGSYEIIVVDNASTDETADWLQQQHDLTVILNENNEGFPKGCNQGIAAAQGELIMLLNNDTVVTCNWLDNLKKCLFSKNQIGAVGPITNNASYYTAIHAPYQTKEGIQQFAQKHNVSNPAKWEERLKLIGFCLLIKREAVEEIGLLDERFGIGNFEDDDYSLRMRKAGYRLMLCRDTFIHHYGSASFNSDTDRYRHVLQENERKFIEKWGFSPILDTMIRYELVSLMDEKGDEAEDLFRVLDISCGCGGTLLQIKNKFPNAELYGIESNTHAGSVASMIANDIGNCADDPSQWTYSKQSFNWILMETAISSNSSIDYLCALSSLLKDEGVMIAFFENIGNLSVEQLDQFLKEAGFEKADLYPINGTDHEKHSTQHFLLKAFKRIVWEKELSIICSELADGINKEMQLLRVAALLSGSLVTYNHIIQTPIPNPLTKAALLAEIAEFLYYRRVNDPVIPLLEAAYALNPKYDELLYNLGFMLMKANKHAEALRYFEEIDDKDEEVIGFINKLKR